MTGKLSLKEIEEEIDDPTIFEGVLAYAKLQKKYTEKPKDKDMTLKEFEAKLEEFKTQKIYKTTETDVKFSKEDMDAFKRKIFLVALTRVMLNDFTRNYN